MLCQLTFTYGGSSHIFTFFFVCFKYIFSWDLKNLSLSWASLCDLLCRSVSPDNFTLLQ